MGFRVSIIFCQVLLCADSQICSRYWGGLEYKTPHFPPLLRGAVNAGSNIGNILGQLSFGFLGDTFGRKFVYGKELIVCIIGTILVISLPNSIPTPTLKMIWIFCFRVVMGIGIGGDYPMSASIVSERSHLKTRGKLLAWIFSNQGWVCIQYFNLRFTMYIRSLIQFHLPGHSSRLNCHHHCPQMFQPCSGHRRKIQPA